MKLWIRSQDKRTLTQADNITTLVEGFKIYTHTPNGYVLLGEYNKKRALEILDEIQNLLNGDLLLIKNCDVDETKLGDAIKPSKYILMKYKKQPKVEYLHRDCVVYEMPEE